MDLVTLALAKQYTNEKIAESGGGSGTSAGFGTPTATATQLESTEQPTVSVSASGPNTEKVFDFTFGIPAGKNGVDGTSAGFGQPTATIDDTTGTPSVQVTASGPDTAKIFNFVFSGLKGEQGESATGGGLEPLTGTTETVTPAQVIEAVQQGRQVVITDSKGVVFSSWSINHGVPASDLTVYDGRIIGVFSLAGRGNDGWAENTIMGSGFTPLVTVSDKGKFLRVNDDGIWAAEAVDFYDKTESDSRYAPIEAAIKVRGKGKGFVKLSPTIKWGVQDLRLYGQSIQQKTTGKQLFNAQKYCEERSEFYQVGNNGGIIQLKSDGIGIASTSPIQLAAGTYTIFSELGRPQVYANDTYVVLGTPGKPSTFTLDADSNVYLKIYIPDAISYPTQEFFVMLNVGSSTLPWEPYTAGQPSPSESYPQPIEILGTDGQLDVQITDGNTQSQQLSIPTTGGLPGVPVDSGGNWTDENGQQWVSDVLDLVVGTKTQYCGQIDSYNGEEITTPYISSTGALTAGAQVVYVLSEPIITSLDAETITAYKALQSYTGTTNILVSDCGIEASVLAEPNQYIEDNIQSAITQSVTQAVTLTGGNTQ